MQFTPIRGFVNTPVSKSICIITTLLTITLSVLQIKFYFNFQIDPFIIEYKQYWRLLIYQLSVVNESDFLLCILLWFQFKNLERFFGSKRYLSNITVFALYNALVCFIIMCLGQILENVVYFIFSTKLNIGKYIYFNGIFNLIIPGPLGIISSLYVCYGKFVPISYKFNILLAPPKSTDSEPTESVDMNSMNSMSNQNQFRSVEQPLGRVLTLTNHIHMQILYTILFLNQGFRSILPCSVGLLLGNLYVNDLLPGASWVIPNVVFKFFVGPIGFFKKSARQIRLATRGGYGRLSNVVLEDIVSNGDDEIDDNIQTRDEDDNTNGANDNGIRAETPVRPLVNQLFDTFRG